jgi:hypothetical protein
VKILRAVFAGASRREDNHQAWEDADPVGAITAKGKHAQELGIRKQNRRKNQTRIQRNNRREY